MDIIKDLYEKKITLDEAHNLLDQVIDDSNNGKYDHLVKDGRIDLAPIIGMDNYEYTAYGQGADFDTIAKWRYEGWPTICAKSGRTFDYKSYGWFVKEINDRDALVLIEEL
jgi:hypothetical protein